ncbi:helix-turn-helix domain-containing protein [Streptomyces sp. NPDC058086]|uniref:helix-turn-helix domain-containing protein n=1 Tax=Streptomyces sp. NPDC058086 TaxID=3346334 RepID=UPI0036E2F3D0
MRGGGLTAERRAFRERIRMQAAELFAQGYDCAAVARELRVSVRSVQWWLQKGERTGEPAPASVSISSLARAGRLSRALC